jgi:hypothetical protein
VPAMPDGPLGLQRERAPQRVAEREDPRRRALPAPRLGGGPATVATDPHTFWYRKFDFSSTARLNR